MLMLFKQHKTAREDVLANLSTELGIDRDMAKKSCLTITHIGHYTQHTGGVKNDFLELFTAAYKSAVKQLKRQAAYQSIWERAQRNAGINPLGTFVHYCCEIQEAAAITALTTFLERRGGIVRTNSFDGLMAAGFELLSDEDMRRLLDEVRAVSLSHHIEG
jgi:hypothetical protein